MSRFVQLVLFEEHVNDNDDDWSFSIESVTEEHPSEAQLTPHDKARFGYPMEFSEIAIVLELTEKEVLDIYRIACSKLRRDGAAKELFNQYSNRG